MVKSPTMDGSGGYMAPAMSAGMSFSDLGSSGLRQFSGWVREEFLQQLVGLQGARVYREMADNSAAVGSILFAISQAMRKVEWRTQPKDNSPAAQEAADFAESLRFDMSHTWDDFIAETLSMLTYGFAPHEIVYKRRNGKSPARGEPGSNYNDGRIGIRRLPIRGQDTIFKWFFDENGTVTGLTQQPWVGTLIDIPIEKLLLFRPTSHKGNPEGRSILRNSYRPYYFIKRLEELEAIMIERFGGLPVLTMPSQMLEAANSGDAVATQIVNEYKRMVRNVRIDEQMGLIIPSDVYQNANGPTSARMFEFKLVTPEGGGKGSVNPELAIERYKLEVLTSVLADFLTLGHSSRGTQSLAISKVDMFFQAIEGWLNSIAAVLNRFLLPRLWRLNGMDLTTMPEWIPDLAQRIDLDSLGTYVLALAQAGMTMFPDEDLENYLRDAAGMPDIGDNTQQDLMGVGADPTMLKRMIAGTAARREKRRRTASVTA
jgi:hypothetical protein